MRPQLSVRLLLIVQRFYQKGRTRQALFGPKAIAEILSELPIFDSDLRRIGDKSAQKCLYLLVF